MISLNEDDKRFYSENADSLLGYIRYIEYVMENREKFGGSEKVELAIHLGKFIGRNEIDSKEFDEIERGVKKLCKNDEKARRAMKILEDEEKLRQLVKTVIKTNPKAFMIVGPKGEILMDSKGTPVPNIMKVSLAIAKELESVV